MNWDELGETLLAAHGLNPLAAPRVAENGTMAMWRCWVGPHTVAAGAVRDVVRYADLRGLMASVTFDDAEMGYGGCTVMVMQTSQVRALFGNTRTL